MIRYRTIQILRSLFIFERRADESHWNLVHSHRLDALKDLAITHAALEAIANRMPDDRGVAPVIDYKKVEQ